METEDSLVLSALQALVQTADFRAVGVLQGQEGGLATDEFGVGHLDLPILLRPGEDGLDVKPSSFRPATLTSDGWVVAGQPIGEFVTAYCKVTHQSV